MAALPFRSALPAIASKVRARCEKKYPQERAPFVLFGVDGAELSQTLEVHVAGNASAGLKRCIEEASRQELAQLGQRSGRHQSLHVVEVVGAEVPPPDAKRVLAAWRELLVNGSKAARGLEALLPGEVHRRSDRSFYRDVEFPEARVKLFDWLGAVAEWRHDDQFGINDLALWKDVLLHRCDVQIMSEDGLIGVASDGVCATRLEPELLPLVRLGLLPGLHLEPGSPLVDSLALRTGKGGEVTSAAVCSEGEAPDWVQAALARLPKGSLPANTTLVIDQRERGDVSLNWTLRRFAPAIELAQACQRPALSRDEASLEDTEGSHTNAFSERQNEVFRITRFEPAPVAGPNGEPPTLLYRITVKNISAQRQTLFSVGCEAGYRRFPIPMMPGEERTLGFSWPMPYMFQGEMEVTCYPGPSSHRLRLPVIRPFDLSWDQPKRVEFVACGEEEVRYVKRPSASEACLALSPKVKTDASRRYGEYYSTFIDEPVEVHCQLDGREHRLQARLGSSQATSWMNPLRIPINAEASSLEVICRLDPEGKVAETDRANNEIRVTWGEGSAGR